jgi:hypothetical protein
MGFYSRHEPIPPRERYTVRGAVIVTIPQLALLQALMDWPDARARSRTAWARSSKPYVTLFRRYDWDSMMLQAYRMPHVWVTRTRLGARIQCQLTDRGRDIVDRRLPAHIYGYGTYWGLRHLVNRGVR